MYLINQSCKVSKDIVNDYKKWLSDHLLPSLKAKEIAEHVHIYSLEYPADDDPTHDVLIIQWHISKSDNLHAVLAHKDTISDAINSQYGHLVLSFFTVMK